MDSACNGHSKITTQIVDSGIVVLANSTFQKLSLGDVRVEFSTGKHRRRITIHQYCQSVPWMRSVLRIAFLVWILGLRCCVLYMIHEKYHQASKHSWFSIQMHLRVYVKNDKQKNQTKDHNKRITAPPPHTHTTNDRDEVSYFWSLRISCFVCTPSCTLIVKSECQNKYPNWGMLFRIVHR